LGRPGWYNRLPARRSLGIDDARRDPISEILAARAQLGQAFARQVAHPGWQLLQAGADLIIALRFALAGLGRGGSGCFASRANDEWPGSALIGYSAMTAEWPIVCQGAIRSSSHNASCALARPFAIVRLLLLQRTKSLTESTS
jgi:hypothetical protein